MPKIRDCFLYNALWVETKYFFSNHLSQIVDRNFFLAFFRFLTRWWHFVRDAFKFFLVISYFCYRGHFLRSSHWSSCLIILFVIMILALHNSVFRRVFTELRARVIILFQIIKLFNKWVISQTIWSRFWLRNHWSWSFLLFLWFFHLNKMWLLQNR